jgi:hypothetical protein
MIVLILPSFFVIRRSTIEGNLICDKIENKELSCTFKCTITSIDAENIKELNGRIIVFHSYHWTAIFDKTYKIQTSETKQFNIELPKRDYTYYAILSMYDNSGGIGVSNEITLLC